MSLLKHVVTIAVVNITLFLIAVVLAVIYDPDITSILSIVWIPGLYLLYHIIIIHRACAADITEESFKSSFIILQHLCMVAVLGFIYYVLFALQATSTFFLMPDSFILKGARVILAAIVVVLFYRIRQDVYNFLVTFWSRR